MKCLWNCCLDIYYMGPVNNYHLTHVNSTLGKWDKATVNKRISFTASQIACYAEYSILAQRENQFQSLADWVHDNPDGWSILY